MKKVLTNTVIILISIALTYALLEIGYRVIKYRQLNNEYEDFWFWWVDAPLFTFDEAIGYRYLPDQERRLTLTDHLDFGIHANQFNVNNAGHISWQDDEVDKPDGEYRIALLGDSFTASNFNQTPWGDTLETLLNDDATLRRDLNVERFNVLNFGMEATGIVQFDDIYLHEVQRYQPDLVIVNFISDDIHRRFVWRDTVAVTQGEKSYQVVLSCYALPISLDNPACKFGNLFTFDHAFLTDKAGLAQMRRDIFQADIDRRPWLAIYPEVLAALIGHQIDLVPRLERGHSSAIHYTNLDTALARSRDALDTLLAAHPQVLLLHNPIHPEYDADVGWTVPDLAQAFFAYNSDLEFVKMSEFLPSNMDEQEIESWFNLPFDGHFSEKGAGIYAEAVYRVLQETMNR